MTPPLDVPETSAELAGLRYVDDLAPGITRRRVGKGFSYRDAGGITVKDRAELVRIRAIAVPPAWTQVWICPDKKGHIQATGRDARGRKQYRYHAEWRVVRDERKFNRLADLGAALPKLRRRVARDMARDGLPVERVVATVVRLLEQTLIRVGNDEYARANGSYGLTTIKARHARVVGGHIRFDFIGKHGTRHDVDIDDVRTARIVRRCQDLPGQALFRYIDATGECRTVGSSDVNDYIRTVTGEPFTAKDFRTWGATLLAARTLRAAEAQPSQRQAVRALNEALAEVAAALHNTVAICRSSYVHPAIMDAFLDGTLEARWTKAATTARGGTRSEETTLIAFLRAAARARTNASTLKKAA